MTVEQQPLRTEECSCPVCGPYPFETLLLTDGLRLVTCAGCGLIFVNPRLGAQARREHFSARYIPSLNVLHTSFEARRDLALDRIAHLVRTLLPAGGTILDVGCAGGAFLRRFDDAKWQRVGVEPSLVASDHARLLAGAEIHTGDLLEAAFPEGRFDVVTLLDTLIVVPDPREVLNECRRILRPSGLLFVELPGYNFRALRTTSLGSKLLAGGLNPRELLYHFPDRSIRRLLKACGFDVLGVNPSAPSIYGNAHRRLLLRALDVMTLATHRLSAGHINLLPKYVYASRKRPK